MSVEIVENGNVCIPEHCYYCFDSLLCALKPDLEPIPLSFPNEKYPLFVTWNTLSSRPGGHPRLRGCIGNFEPMELHSGLKEYALISAFHDTRFSPIAEKELPRLQCAVSLLTDFEDADTYLDWTVGVHGIYITFPHPNTLPPPSSSLDPSPLSSSSNTPVPPSERKGRFKHPRSSLRPLTATYLPDVVPDQGWTKQQAVDSAIKKAGWDGRITEDIRRSIKLRRYQSRKCDVTWDEFMRWRGEHEEAEEEEA